MKNQVLVRSLIGLASIFALYGGYALLREWLKDPDVGAVDSVHMIAAVEYLDEGSQVVLFDPKGEKRVVPDYQKGVSDTEPVWRPDGQRVFFTSDRGGQSASIYRWNIADDTVDQRSLGTRSESGLHYGPEGWPGLINSGLMLSGGTVQEFDQREKRTVQVLPPTRFQGSVPDEMQESIAGRYQQIGTSFKSAKWGKDRKVIYSVMARENDEVFVVNYMEPMGQIPIGPIPLMAGASIQFDVAPDGSAAVSVQNFDFPEIERVPKEFIVEGRILKPFRNCIVKIGVAETGEPSMEYVFTDNIDLGAGPATLTPELRKKSGVPASINGIFVEEIGAGGPADQVGVKPGDVIVSVGGVPVTDQATLGAALQRILIGQTATIVYYSKGGGLKSVPYEFGTEPTLHIRDLAVSPDSKSLAVSMGRLTDKYSFVAWQLAVMPFEGSGISKVKPLVTGAIYEPCWSPDGKKLVYTKVGPSGDSQIFTINADGSDERNLSGPGDYGSPKFSPTKAK